MLGFLTVVSRIFTIIKCNIYFKYMRTVAFFRWTSGTFSWFFLFCRPPGDNVRPNTITRGNPPGDDSQSQIGEIPYSNPGPQDSNPMRQKLSHHMLCIGLGLWRWTLFWQISKPPSHFAQVSFPISTYSTVNRQVLEQQAKRGKQIFMLRLFLNCPIGFADIVLQFVLLLSACRMHKKQQILLIFLLAHRLRLTLS